MTSLNERAWEVLGKTIDDEEGFGIGVERPACGTFVVDAGVKATGGLQAGLAMARIGMAGLGEAWLEMAPAAGVPWMWAAVHSDHPFEACFLSQSAHWPVQSSGYRAMGSGPACLLNRELGIGEKFGFKEKADCAVLVLEAAALPGEDVCRELAGRCGVSPDKLAVIIAPTSSLAGSAQIAARSVETGLHRLHSLGFDLRKAASAAGRCPMAGPTGSDLASLGKTNDMVMFGSQVWLAVRGVSDAELEDWTRQLPASTSPGYGEGFLETIKKAGGFYAVDPGLFAPAEATLTSLNSGRVFNSGGIDQERLKQALGV